MGAIDFIAFLGKAADTDEIKALLARLGVKKSLVRCQTASSSSQETSRQKLGAPDHDLEGIDVWKRGATR